VNGEKHKQPWPMSASLRAYELGQYHKQNTCTFCGEKKAEPMLLMEVEGEVGSIGLVACDECLEVAGYGPKVGGGGQ